MKKIFLSVILTSAFAYGLDYDPYAYGSGGGMYEPEYYTPDYNSATDPYMKTSYGASWANGEISSPDINIIALLLDPHYEVMGNTRRTEEGILPSSGVIDNILWNDTQFQNVGLGSLLFYIVPKPLVYAGFLMLAFFGYKRYKRGF